MKVRKFDFVKVKGIYGTGWDVDRKGKNGLVLKVSDDQRTAIVKFEDGKIDCGDVYGLEVIPRED